VPAATPWQQSLREAQIPVTGLLKPMGFKKSGNYYNRSLADGLVQVVGFQSGQYVSVLHGNFTVNLGVYVPCVAELEGNASRGRYVTDAHCEIRQRLSAVAHLGKDKWWPLNHRSARTGELLADALQRHGVPFLDRYSSFTAIIARFQADGELPFHNPARSALAVALIYRARGDVDMARQLFDEARRRASNHDRFRAYVTEMQQRCSL
jgi:Domain of unknown function (DUF4304)